MSNPILSIKGITKSFDGVTYLNNISMDLYKGKFHLIAGTNGSGKTLLMKHLNGLYPVKKETIFFNGECSYKKEKMLLQKIGLVFQNPDTQIIGLTVEEDIRFGLKNLKIPKQEQISRVESILERLQITHLRDRNPHTLSGGEKKRVNIAGVLVMQPEILILDEPFIGLDYPGVQDILTLITKLKASGETIILISHDLEKVAAYVDHSYILYKGEIVNSGSMSEVIDNVEQWGIRRPKQDRIEDMTWLK